MDSAAVRRRDTTKGPPLRILSLDGGGVRGYSMLILLQELMHRTFVEIEGRAPKRSEVPKPCDHFDLIAGTGTGGLIAIMLGRLRLDLETCKDVYVRMTKRVFETDKTIAGIPYRSTLFKASRLEDAIRDCVREHTIFDSEGRDASEAESQYLQSPTSPLRSGTVIYGAPQRNVSNASRYSLIGQSPTSHRSPMAGMRWGNPNALLYDSRENRTKTAVTAVYQGTKSGGASVMLRSYDSRKEPAVEPEATIWQAGRATAATGLAFKAIQVGQSRFLDEGSGKFNPAPQVLDEAVLCEWPGRDVGVFVSIGTGKRPASSSEPQHLWWEGFVGSNMDNFAEARRRLIAKIEGCEETHQYMMHEHLPLRGVNAENYYRLNVEVGVGEFGMNEWNRLADISTNTRRYLTKDEVQSLSQSAASRIAKIHFAKARWERGLEQRPLSFGDDQSEHIEPADQPVYIEPANQPVYIEPADPMAVELPANEEVSPFFAPHHAVNHVHGPQTQYRGPLWDEKFLMASADADYRLPSTTPPRQTFDRPTHYSYSANPSDAAPPRWNGEETRTGGDGECHHPPNLSAPPPVPPKTPIQGRTRPVMPPPPAGPTPQPPPTLNPLRMHPTPHMARPPPGAVPPYPYTDGPLPVVNMARKPNMSSRFA